MEVYPWKTLRYFDRLKNFGFIFVALLLAPPALAESSGNQGDIQFRASYYQRDLHTNSLRAKGNAWVRRGEKEIWADEIEVDFNTNKAIANGNVRVREGNLEMWGNHLSYWLSGTEAILEDAVVVSGQLVMTGAVIHKKNGDEFEIEEGSYSNCNIDLLRDKNVQDCSLDWKLHGRRISVRIDGYAHIYDGIIYIKQLPIFYTPYFIFPVKSRRQTGFLLPLLSYHETLGSGTSFPYFIALDRWHDATITPTQHSKAGYHLGVNYRYIYSPTIGGNFNFFITQRRISTLPGPNNENLDNVPLYGLVGKWAIDARNVYTFGERSHTRQTIKLVSDPYYTFDHAQDLGPIQDLAALRSQVSVTLPWDKDLLTGKATHFQSLLVSEDRGVDGGAPTQAPSISYSRLNTSLVDRYLSYEVDTTFDNFYRYRGFDQVPGVPVASGLNFDSTRQLDANDYIRAGRRLSVEPRLIAQVPMPPGFQFQPVFKAGSLLYHFDLPQSQVLHREYLETELPVMMTLSRTFSPGIEGFERIGHIFQTRFIYATSPYQSSEGSHPFFYRDNNGLSSPRFDIRDQITPYEYMRFELVNRFLRQLPSKASERFLRLQVSEQLNLRTFHYDPRYQRRVGPLELLLEARIWRIAAQMQANYQLEVNNGVRENEWSSSIEYQGEQKDLLRINSRFVESADTNLRQQSLYLTFFKRLPIFFDIGGQAEYSLLHGEMLGHMLGFYFESKPRTCWGLAFETGRDTYNNPFARFNFKLYFGNPNDVRPF